MMEIVDEQEVDVVVEEEGVDEEEIIKGNKNILKDYVQFFFRIKYFYRNAARFLFS